MLRMAPLISFIVLLMLSSVALATSSERLYYASKGGYFQAAKNLVEVGRASTAYKNPNGETALFAAAQTGRYNIAEYLLEPDALRQLNEQHLYIMHQVNKDMYVLSKNKARKYSLMVSPTKGGKNLKTDFDFKNQRRMIIGIETKFQQLTTQLALLELSKKNFPNKLEQNNPEIPPETIETISRTLKKNRLKSMIRCCF